MSKLSQFFGSGSSGIPLDMLIVGGGGGSGSVAGGPSPNGSFTIPSGELQSQCYSHNAESGMGGPGAVYEVFGYPAAPGGTYPITVGSGGAGGTGGQNTGTKGANGGASAFVDPGGETLQALGGGGGGVTAHVIPNRISTPLPSYVADPSLGCGNPGGTGGGGSFVLKAVCPQTPSPGRYNRTCALLGGTGAYQDSFITSTGVGNCCNQVCDAGVPEGKRTRWGHQRGNSAVKIFTANTTGGTCMNVVGTGYQIASCATFAKNPIQASESPNCTDQRGYCTCAKYPACYYSVQSNITGIPACYGVTRGICAPVAQGTYFTPSQQPEVPATCWNSCYICTVNQVTPHPNDNGYGLGGYKVDAMLGFPLPSPTNATQKWMSSPGRTGSSGSVTVRYPASWGATPAPQRSGSVDCSPNTPGYYTYRWTSPGSITLP